VRVDPARLAAVGLGVGEVVEAMSRAQVAIPAGSIAAPGARLVLRVSGRMTVDALGTVAIATRDGVPVRVTDVANIETRAVPRPCPPPAPAGAIVVSSQAGPGADLHAIEATARELAHDAPIAVEVAVERAPIHYDVALTGGADGRAALALAPRWRTALAAAPGVRALDPAPAPAEGWSIVRDAAADLGVPVPRIATALAMISGGVDAATIDDGPRRTPVRVRIPLDHPADLALLRVRAASGLVPLEGLVRLAPAAAPIARFDGAPAAILRFAVAPGPDADDRATAAIARAREAAPPPAGVRVTSWREP
jgi:multidrug efflux pump subunit AcrB